MRGRSRPQRGFVDLQLRPGVRMGPLAPADEDPFASALAARGLLLVVLIVLACGVIWVRVAQLQGWKRAELEKVAAYLQPSFRDPAGQPGSILDCHERAMAVSSQVFSLKLDPSNFRNHLPDPKAQAEAVRIMAEALGKPEQEIREKVDSTREWVYLARGVSPQTKEGLLQALREKDVAWVVPDPEYVRQYPMGTTAAALLGWRGPDHAARCGLEQMYDFLLTGLPGSRVGNRDRFGRLVLWRPEKEPVEARPGKSVVLTVDADLQQATELALNTVVRDHTPRACYALAMAPKTGAILAIDSRPTFDPNWFSGAASRTGSAAVGCRKPTDADLSNPAVNEGVEPGSVMKLFTIATALDLHLTREGEGFHCSGQLPDVGGAPLYCAEGRSHGDLDLVGVAARSCNISAARLAERIGGERLVEALKRYGFGQPTRIGLCPEGHGLLPPGAGHERLYRRDVANLGFGQGMSCTLIQLAAAYCGLVNDGVYMLPYVVRAVVQEDGSLFREVKPKELRRVCTAETSARVRRMLKVAVEEGTGRAAAIKGVSVGGKTGTAQKPRPGGGYYPDRHVAVFVMVLPAEDPDLVIAVMVDEPKNGYHGGDVAAPAAREIALAALRLRGELPAEAELQKPTG